MFSHLALGVAHIITHCFFAYPGHGYLVDGDKQLLALDMCSRALVQQGDVLMIKERGCLPVPVTQFFHEHTLHEFRMPCACPGSGEEQWGVQLALHSHTYHGCSVWWDMSSMYKALGLSSCKGEAWRWVCKQWGSWAGTLKNLHASPAHLRKQQPNGGIIDGRRTLDFPSASSLAFIMLLARFTSGSTQTGGFRDAGAASAARLVFSSLTKWALQGQIQSITLFFDISAVPCPPAFPEGTDPCQFTLEGDTMCKLPVGCDASPGAPGLREWTTLVSKLPSADGKVDFSSLISTVVGFGAKLAHIAIQLIWFLALILDTAVKLQLTTGQVPGHGGSKAVGKSGISKNSFFFWREWRKREKLIWKYWLASRRVFQKPDFLSVSLDGSRVAKKGMIYGMLVHPDGVAMWTCPQAQGRPQDCPPIRPPSNLNSAFNKCVFCIC